MHALSSRRIISALRINNDLYVCLRTQFTNLHSEIDRSAIHGYAVVSSFRDLGLTIKNDLSPSNHIADVVVRAHR